MIYTEDRQVFEDKFYRPPFLARMLERAALYIDGLDEKDYFLRTAFDMFWGLRDKITITCANDVTLMFDAALRATALSRSKWLVHYGAALELTKWVRGTRLGRRE